MKSEATRNPPPREAAPVVIHLNLARTAAREYLDEAEADKPAKKLLDPGEVDYRASSTMDNCGGCRHSTFTESAEPNGSCALVDSPIRRAFVCDRYAAVAPAGKGR